MNWLFFSYSLLWAGNAFLLSTFDLKLFVRMKASKMQDAIGAGSKRNIADLTLDETVSLFRKNRSHLELKLWLGGKAPNRRTFPPPFFGWRGGVRFYKILFRQDTNWNQRFIPHFDFHLRGTKQLVTGSWMNFNSFTCDNEQNRNIWILVSCLVFLVLISLNLLLCNLK